MDKRDSQWGGKQKGKKSSRCALRSERNLIISELQAGLVRTNDRTDVLGFAEPWSAAGFNHLIFNRYLYRHTV